uniref:Uncharacterized protein n=1 Tax=Arundo donax TaxID=35708 RepID=A0A0A9A963_ARUDO
MQGTKACNKHSINYRGSRHATCKAQPSKHIKWGSLA